MKKRCWWKHDWTYSENFRKRLCWRCGREEVITGPEVGGLRRAKWELAPEERLLGARGNYTTVTFRQHIEVEVEADYTPSTPGKMGKDPDDSEPPCGACIDDVKVSAVFDEDGKEAKVELPSEVVEKIEAADDFREAVEDELAAREGE